MVVVVVVVCIYLLQMPEENNENLSVAAVNALHATRPINRDV
jgi:hypothetical protein